MLAVRIDLVGASRIVVAAASSRPLIRIGHAMLLIETHLAILAMVGTSMVRAPANAHHVVRDACLP